MDETCRRPIIQVMGPPLVSLGSGLGQWGRQVLLLGRSCATAGGLAVKAVMGPPMTAFLAALKAVGHFMHPLWQLRWACNPFATLQTDCRCFDVWRASSCHKERIMLLHDTHVCNSLSLFVQWFSKLVLQRHPAITHGYS